MHLLLAETNYNLGAAVKLIQQIHVGSARKTGNQYYFFFLHTFLHLIVDIVSPRVALLSGRCDGVPRGHCKNPYRVTNQLPQLHVYSQKGIS